MKKRLLKRLLIIGCGDIGRRLVPLVLARYRVYALARGDAQAAAIRALGALPIPGDLDDPRSLGALNGIAHDIVHLAPPPAHGAADTRTAHLIAALGARNNDAAPRQLVYISTSGVYGDCAGAQVTETWPTQPQTARAQRRADAERRLRAWGARAGVTVSILRVPGIYAADRLPLERLQRGTPAITDEEDGYVNHVHADDLARMVLAALARGKPGRAYNATDDAPQKMGEYFDWVADRHGLPRPPRIARSEAVRVLPPTLLSFMSESRQLTNARIKRELRVRLRYPTVQQGVPKSKP
jgi:nucleoside-diphosphate-sugar epimerase